MSKKRRKKQAQSKRRRASRRAPDGRVHLIVERDTDGHVRSLALSKPLFDSEWQNRLAIAAASTTHGLLSASSEEERVDALAERLLSAASEVGRKVLEQTSESPVACTRGCDYCCHQAVSASPVEVLHLAAGLLSEADGERKASIRERVRAAAALARISTARERHHPKQPCPLLEDGACQAYELRPLVCRGVNSLSREACRASLHDETTRAAYLDGHFEIERYTEPASAVQAVSAGLQLCASELHRLHVEPLDLPLALCVALDDFENVLAAWLEGGDPFSTCRSQPERNSAKAIQSKRL